MWLGRIDSERNWLSKIEQIGTDKNGVTAFAAYFGGLGQLDRAFISRRLDELTEARQVTAEGIVRATGNLGGDLAGIERMETLIQEKRVDPVSVGRVLMWGRWSNSLNSDEYLRLLKAIAGPKLENAVAAVGFLDVWLHGERPIEGQLAEFAWQCLEAAPPVMPTEAYHCDQLASTLAHSDTERGFRLLEKLLTQPYERACWNPIDRYRRNEFWSVLRKADRERALGIVLSVAFGNPLQCSWVTWHFRGVVDQESAGDILIDFVLESEQQAELVCESITSARPGFWPIALRVIEKYPDSLRIQNSLASCVQQIGWSVSGPWSARLENRRKDVERVLNDAATPIAARPCLEELESSLRTQAEQRLISEIDEEVNELRHVVEDPASPERLWAINTLLRLGKVHQVRKLLSEDELLTILPKLQLPEGDSEEIRRRIEA